MKPFITLFEEAGAGGGGGGAPTFTPSFEGALQPDGSFAEGWHQKAFGADYNGPLASAKTFGDVNKMLTDSMTAARQKTEGMVKLPGENATPEDWQAYHKAIGVPDDPTEYGIKAPEKLPDGVAWDDKAGAAFAAKAKELGLTKTQAAKLAEFQMELTGGSVAEMRANAAKVMEAEKAEMSKRFGADIDKTVAAAKSLETAKGVPDTLKAQIKEGAFDPQSPNFWGVDALEAFAWAAKATGEDKGGGGPGGTVVAMDLAAAKDIMTNKDNPLNAKYWAGDKETVDRVNAAYKQASA
ncbi:hypothetical protein WJU23_05270 [Prosthecobacter sp. SYSU 5D2]|uniref:hypothetical protein n=1 Tax=Prosthecobacter sp. SYSU 5D2 TaxID=3134134 RepID=UPI0031FF17AF